MKQKIVSIFIFLAAISCNNNPNNIPIVKDTIRVVDTIKVAQVITPLSTEVPQPHRVHHHPVAQNPDPVVHADNTDNSANGTTVAGQSAPPVKKGWSAAATDATIGGASAGILGAIIDKNHVQGGIIGGIVGAGAGYLLGRARDRKTGRVVKRDANTTPPPNNN